MYSRLTGRPGDVLGMRPTHFDPWPPPSRRIVARYKGEIVPPGRVVTIDAQGLLWLPNAATPRTLYGLSLRALADGIPFAEWNIEELQQTLASDMSTMLSGHLFVESDGSPFTGGVVNVHAASTGPEVCRRGVVTSCCTSTVPGQEVIALPGYDLAGPTSNDRVWYLGVNLP